nr:EpsG family protein [uncultured Chitinophaga sp.]
MTFYVLLAIFVVITASLARFVKEADRRLIFWFIVVCLMAVSSCREMVGEDFPGYVDMYNHPDNYPVEPFFYVLIRLLRLTGFSYTSFFVVTSVISVWLFWDAIRKHSTAVALSLVLYVLLGLYTTSFNIVRHFLALGIILNYGYPPLRDKQLKQYLLIVVIAAFFHVSALLAIPIFFLAYKRITLPFAVIGVLIAVIINSGVGVDLMLSAVSVVIPGKYMGYLQFLPLYLKELNEPLILKIVNNADKIAIAFTLIAYQKKLLSIDSRYQVLINLFFYNLVFAIALRGVGPLQRIIFYFSIFSVLAIPLLLYIPEGKFSKLWMTVAIILVYFFYFVFIIVNKDFGGIVPYQTIF